MLENLGLLGHLLKYWYANSLVVWLQFSKNLCLVMCRICYSRSTNVGLSCVTKISLRSFDIFVCYVYEKIKKKERINNEFPTTRLD